MPLLSALEVSPSQSHLHTPTQALIAVPTFTIPSLPPPPASLFPVIGNSVSHPVNSKVLPLHTLYHSEFDAPPLFNPLKGDIHHVKAPDVFRFLYQNINGLRIKTFDKWMATVVRMFDLQCDLVGLNETCTNWKLHTIKQRCLRILQTIFKNSSIIVSTNPVTSDTPYLPGGTATVSLGVWNSKILQKLYDPTNMGRWTGASYSLSDTGRLHSITAYRVCPNTLSIKNSLSTFSQQSFLLKQKGIINPDPRTQFLVDLTTYINNMKLSVNDYLLLSLDCNNTSDNKDVIQDLCNDCNLVDLYMSKHQDEEQFPTHANGSVKIDFLLRTPNLLPFVTKVGYVRFHEAFDSDHRAIYCDISNSLLGPSRTVQSPLRRIVGTSSTNAEGEQYIRHINTNFQRHNIYNKLDHIQQSLDELGPYVLPQHIDTFMLSLNKMDLIITNTMIHAEKTQCKRRPITMYSKTLDQANLRAQYWNVLSKIQRQRLTTRDRLLFIQSQLTVISKAVIEANTLTPQAAFRHALAEYNSLKKHHFSLRDEHVQSTVDDLNKRNCQSQAVTVEALLAREQRRRDFAYIKHLTKHPHSSGISTLEVPFTDSPTGLKFITAPVQVEEKILHRNIGHFAQAEGTPFTLPPLQDVFQYEGVNTTVTALINDQIIPPSLQDQPPYIQDILQQLADGKNLPTFPSEISYSEFVNAFIKWNEKTTTSPSGRHLGHYKLLTRLNIYCEIDSTLNLSEKILRVYYQVAMLAARMGRSLDRWNLISTIMIEKQKGCPRLDKLRVIHLFEADYNLLLKIIWARKAVWQLHDNNRINSGQAGSRPGSRAIDVVINKEMKYLYARLTRTALGTIDNDAKSCYYRILCNLAMAISEYYGVPSSFCHMQAHNLKHSVFRLRTALGDSNKTYTNTPTTPIHGTGQGSCASPALWLMISSFLMDILQRRAHGMQMMDIMNSKPIHQWIDGFVNDTSIFTNNRSPHDSVAQLKEKLEFDGNYWAGLLAASGGHLELIKCFYYILTWSWDHNGNPSPQLIVDQDKNTSPLILTTSHGIDQELHQKDISHSHKTLGVFKSILGDDHDHYVYLLEKNNRLASVIANGQVSRQQAQLAYNTSYISSMTYSLPATTMTLFVI
jgi:hypothetical protein